MTTAFAMTDLPRFAIPLEKVSLGKNYRHRHGPKWSAGLEELAASMTKNGQLEEIMVRPKPKGKDGEYEVVFGERRWRAAKIAELETIDAKIRELTDDEVLDLQIAENNGREDPHPLDEAEGFAELVKRGRTPAQIAERLGRDVGYVSKRLALCKLSKKCQKALDEETITFGVALLLARMPSEKLQEEALNDVGSSRFDGLCPVGDARRIIEENYMLSLADAPFDTKSAELVAKVGPCTTCPKRTGVQHELFDDLKSKDLCTDKPCFDSKVEALWQIRKKEAEAGGQKVLEGKAAQDALRYGGSHVSLDQEEWTGSKQVKVRKLLGKDLPETTLARAHDGRVLELVKREDFNKAIRAKYPRAVHEERGSGDGGRAAQKRAEAKQRIRRKAIRAAIAEAVEKVGKVPEDDVVELIVRAFAARVWNEVQRDVLERRVGLPKNGGYEAAIVKLVKDMRDPTDVLGMGLELALRSGAPWHGAGDVMGGADTLWRDGLKLVGVKFDKHEREAQAAAKASKGKPKSGIVHLIDHDNPKGTACGSLPGTGVGSGARSGLNGVTCKNCKRVGPAVLARKPKRKPAKKRSRK